MRIRRNMTIILIIIFILFIQNLAIQATDVDVKAKTVRVAVCPHMPPYQFLDDNNQLSGIHIDIIENIANQNNLSIIYTIYNTKSECIDALNKDTVDIILGYQTQDYDNINHIITGEMSSGTIGVVANKEVADRILQTKRTPFAVVYEYGVVNYSLLHSLGFHRLIGMSSQEQAAEFLISQKADTTVGITESIEYILRQQGVEKDFKTLQNRVGTTQYAILVNKNSSSLYHLLNKALIDMHISGTHENIIDEWIPNPAKQLQNTISKLAVVAVTVMLGTTVVLWFNHLLRKKVGIKTNMLYELNQSLETTIEKLQNEAVFRNRMINSLPVPAILFNPDFSVTLMNPKARSLCNDNYSDEEEINVKNLPVFGQILQQMKGDFFSDDFQIEKKHFFNLSSPQGLQKYHCWIYPLLEGDSYTSTMMMVENVTEEVQRRNERFAIEKANSLNQVVAGIAHEIKNPLMTIKMATSLMATNWENPDIKDAFTQFIPDEVDRMDGMVQSLINYTKPPNETFSVFCLSEMTQNSFSLAKISDNKSQIEFSIVMDDTLYILGQRGLLRQALTNLFLNSMWAVKKRCEAEQSDEWIGIISVKVYDEDSMACLSIYDNGVGMPADVAGRCMEPFYTTKIAGTGLGLALAKQYVENSKGTISVFSEENQYTQILIRFPKHVDKQEQVDCEENHG